MSEVLSRAQLYIQLEEAMKSSVNHSLKHSNDGERIEHATQDSDPYQQSESGADHLQEAGIPDSFPRSTLSLQSKATLHLAEAPYERRLQCHQRLTMNKAPKIEPT